MLKKTVCTLIGILACVFMFGSLSMAGDHYVNGIDANFPPFAYVDDAGNPAGFDVECADWIAEKMGFTIEHKPVEWSAIIPTMLAGKIDFIASGMSITEERAKQVTFSIPYWVIKQVFVVKEDSTLTVDDILKGDNMALGVQSGTSEAEWLKEEKEAQGFTFDLRFYDSSPLSVEDVLNGRIAAAAMDDAPAQDAVNKKPVKIIGTFGMHEENFGYATRQEDTELMDMLNQGLEMLMNDPKWEELKAKYEL